MTIKKRMLINAIHDEESRVAIIEGDYLQELEIESANKVVTKSNIYKGKITKIEGSLQAAFVEYGAARQGFLPIGEIHPDYWKNGVDKSANPRNLSIQNILEGKQEILVQVVKEERGNKGAALTTHISLAGRYLVLSPNTPRGGISRKLSDEARRHMKQILKQLEVPDEMGLIIRTAGKDQTLEALQRDYQYLRRLWDEIRISSEQTSSPALIYLDGDLATRAIRDHFSDDIDEIWVDNHEVYTRTKSFVHAVLPGKEKLVKLYRGKKPLFRHYGIEPQCEELHQREIRLPSGGSIVLDPTEALTAIDINSGRSTKGKHIDDTALATNLEAAEEIARQLRIRDIGGLIVIDFIDMANRKHGQQVEEVLRKACKGDKARIQFARISRFGLLEMSRQRLHPSMRETTTQECPRCQGKGSIRTVDSMALQMLTRMEDWAERGKKPTLVVQVPSDTGEYLMNHKRDYIARIEDGYEVQITLQIRPDLNIPHYRIERQWTENNQQRVEVLEDTAKRVKPPRASRKMKPMKPIVGIPTPVPPAAAESTPSKAAKKKENPIKAIINLLIGKKKPGSDTTAAAAAQGATEPANSQNDTNSSSEQSKPSRPKRRRRNNRNRRGGGQNQGGQQASEQNNAQQRDKAERNEANQDQSSTTQANNSSEAASGEVKKRRRRRRRRKPAAQGSGNPQERSAQDSTAENGTADKPAREPRAERHSHESNDHASKSRASNSGESTSSKPKGDSAPRPASEASRQHGAANSGAAALAQPKQQAADSAGE